MRFWRSYHPGDGLLHCVKELPIRMELILRNMVQLSILMLKPCRIYLDVKLKPSQNNSSAKLPAFHDSRRVQFTLKLFNYTTSTPILSRGPNWLDLIHFFAAALDLHVSETDREKAEYIKRTAGLEAFLDLRYSPKVDAWILQKIVSTTSSPFACTKSSCVLSRCSNILHSLLRSPRTRRSSSQSNRTTLQCSRQGFSS
jgi:hypothetical protein